MPEENENQLEELELIAHKVYREALKKTLQELKFRGDKVYQEALEKTLQKSKEKVEKQAEQLYEQALKKTLEESKKQADEAFKEANRDFKIAKWIAVFLIPTAISILTFFGIKISEYPKKIDLKNQEIDLKIAQAIDKIKSENEKEKQDIQAKVANIISQVNTQQETLGNLITKTFDIAKDVSEQSIQGREDISQQLSEVKSLSQKNKDINEQITELSQLKSDIRKDKEQLDRNNSNLKKGLSRIDNLETTLKANEQQRSNKLQVFEEELKKIKLCRMTSVEQGEKIAKTNFDTIDNLIFELTDIESKKSIESLVIKDTDNRKSILASVENIKVGDTIDFTRSNKDGDINYTLKVVLLADHKKDFDIALFELCKYDESSKKLTSDPNN